MIGVAFQRLGLMGGGFRGLLDLYPGAAAAYSLRSLSAAWLSQPVVRVRRSSDNAEADFTAAQVTDGTLAAWVGAGNDGFVRTWYDQSGNERDAEQATAGSQPQIVDDGTLLTEGQKPSLQFNESLLRTSTDFPLLSQSQNFEFYHVTKHTGADGHILGQMGAEPSFAFFMRETEFRVGYRVSGNNGAGLRFTGLMSTYRLANAWNDAGFFRAFINDEFSDNQTASTFISYTGSNPSFCIGARVDGSTAFGGLINELIVYLSHQDAVRQGIRANMNNHWEVF